MATTNVNPTRMELTRLKKRLAVAVRGHKLLKDKRDEMVRQFVLLIRQNKELREAVEASLVFAMQGFVLAKAQVPDVVMEEALMVPARSMTLDVSSKNIMSVEVPQIHMTLDANASMQPYSFATTPGELDESIVTLSDLLPQLVGLAEIEKSCQMLADEIEKTRRRVNALEHVMIPQMQETIRSITMKLEENDRSSRTRLMKVKEMLAKEA